MRSLAAIRREFPVTERLIHLNHAGVSPISRACAEAMQAHADDVCRYGTRNAGNWHRRVADARAGIAALIGCQPEEVAFTKNTTHSIILVANVLPWREGDNVVITDLEFPANVYPWLSLEWRGVETRIVRRGRDGRVAVDDLAAAMDGRTRALAVSWVEFSNGFRHDVAVLSELCAKFGAYLLLDVIQGVGALQVDLSRLGVDFAAGAAHKWLLGPEGFGYLYCRRDVVGELLPAMAGWRSVVNPDDYLDYDFTLRDDAGRFEEGGLSTVGASGFEAAVRLLREFGADEIEARVRELTDWLVEGLRRIGYAIRSPRGEGEWSGIVAAEVPQGEPEQVVSALRRANIVAAVRDGAVRLSPHFYNTTDELSAALDIMREAGD